MHSSSLRACRTVRLRRPSFSRLASPPARSANFLHQIGAWLAAQLSLPPPSIRRLPAKTLQTAHAQSHPRAAAEISLSHFLGSEDRRSARASSLALELLQPACVWRLQRCVCHRQRRSSAATLETPSILHSPLSRLLASCHFLQQPL